MTTTKELMGAAASALGWSGRTVGPVEFGGIRFWAITEPDSDTDATSERRVVGCLLRGPATSDLQRAASLLAAYTPRAIVVDAGADLTRLQVDAAILDQGIVEVDPDGDTRCLSTAGPRVCTGPVPARERRFLEAITATDAAEASQAEVDEL